MTVAPRRRLTLGVDLAHVDDALHAEQRGCRCRCDTVLACPGLGDQATLAETLREQRLTEHVVDLVRAGVVEILTLQDDAGVTRVLREPRNLGDDAGATRVGRMQVGELGLERGIGAGELIRGIQLVERGDQ